MSNAAQSASQTLEANRIAPIVSAGPDEGFERRTVARALIEPLDVRTDHLVAAGGAVLFLIAGAVCGAWMQIV